MSYSSFFSSFRTRVADHRSNRVRPPAAKLAKSSQVIEERAWDVDEESGRVALKTGPSEFIFGAFAFRCYECKMRRMRGWLTR